MYFQMYLRRHVFQNEAKIIALFIQVYLLPHLLCALQGKQGITPITFPQELDLHAQHIINISMILLFTSLIMFQKLIHLLHVRFNSFGMKKSRLKGYHVTCNTYCAFQLLRFKCNTYFDPVWMIQTSFPRTDSCISTTVSRLVL